MKDGHAPLVLIGLLAAAVALLGGLFRQDPVPGLAPGPMVGRTGAEVAAGADPAVGWPRPETAASRTAPPDPLAGVVGDVEPGIPPARWTGVTVRRFAGKNRTAQALAALHPPEDGYEDGPPAHFLAGPGPEDAVVALPRWRRQRPVPGAAAGRNIVVVAASDLATRRDPVLRVVADLIRALAGRLPAGPPVIEVGPPIGATEGSPADACPDAATLRSWLLEDADSRRRER